MKKILITGKHSYIGNQFSQWLAQWPEDYKVVKESLRDGTWRQSDWSNYDVILHVAGIAHNSSDPKLEDLYYEVNRDLTIEAAKKAKAEGVGQFIFMSSIIVFGSKVSKITKDTPTNPDNFYGDSKLQAEAGLGELADDQFKVAIVRPPMVYGPGSKGNFPKLSKLAQKTPIFPNYANKRSMLFIDNLSAALTQIIDEELIGNFYPQNEEYVATSQMVKEIADVHNHQLALVKGLTPFVRIALPIKVINKVFGDLYYDKDLSDNLNNVVKCFRRTIEITEEGY
ncbi:MULTISPECIES: NAD-dependent epimerase/dehydratase family protein [Aerococcus]|uniref:NAD-dependent epimerase/dehydratase family protein n=1 Tax=Aerococcus urinae (strain CCUG 59500 / ACS-120-V-Col10a) TaxID=2976812 RepID=UPI000200E705|nr:NAD-dependent epimerase/dehydratase family protein [Aerococcus sp. Group 1]AEA00564.1 NAD dependent epimerase/dehydratase family protein [Aerococcus sp. Group 1]MCY3030590.1 NAD-dependent epimerase/dehydratase family protein [Aerococcus sp. Group 1]MCY3054739.1 NAD-dependent epimerase/dehydratase family protein [Aerococcus sp. Group 1]MCY3056469.1 NAD-dependent epimerase/dehydratase family protein [Aerococcus sp. Group 1]MCY3061273.1 NAD-dependent epimerase/dehydratase family protein [Aeroc